MVGKRVDGIYNVNAIDRFAVTLERVLLRLRLGRRVEELDRDTALDAARGVPQLRRHARNAPRHVLHGRLAALPGLDLHGSGSRVHRRALQQLHLVYVHRSARHGDHQLVRREGYRERLAWEGDGGRRLARLGERVHVERAVPGGGYADVGAGRVCDGPSAVFVRAQNDRVARVEI